ncbi:MAG TPA: hypothetical protein VGL55_11210 [Steroidobacteraceae bacterium]|jgi:hypothetical protein
MRIQGITHARLMDESEVCVSETAKFGTPAQVLVASRLLSHPETYRRWESEHGLLMRQVSRHTYLHRQVIVLRSTALSLLHRKAIFEYLTDRPLTAAQRRRLIGLFHSFKDYTSSLIAEHGSYLRVASSYWCAHHFARRLTKDSAFAEPLHLYQERYTDYFRVFCDVELAETEEEKRTVEPIRLLKPLLKLQLSEARHQILTMTYHPTKVWHEVEIRRPTGDTARLRTLPAASLARHAGAAPAVHSGIRK